jgi:hypothetical protein
MPTDRMTRLAVGLTVAGVVMIVGGLVSGDRSLTPSWDALRSAGSAVTLVWTWATTPRLDREHREKEPWKRS